MKKEIKDKIKRISFFSLITIIDVAFWIWVISTFGFKYTIVVALGLLFTIMMIAYWAPDRRFNDE